MRVSSRVRAGTALLDGILLLDLGEFDFFLFVMGFREALLTRDIEYLISRRC
jgi:hypothetical protein